MKDSLNYFSTGTLVPRVAFLTLYFLRWRLGGLTYEMRRKGGRKDTKKFPSYYNLPH